MSSFDKALEEGTLLKQILANDDHERQFRAAMRNKEEKLIAYFLQPAVLEDLVRVFVDEEERSLQEASEVLGIVLANIDEVTTAIVDNHLPLFFSYLDRDVMNPRRLYYFLRVASFLFQNRTPELFAFAQASETFTLKLVKHLSSVHIMQLVQNMLKLEDQMREMGVAGCAWSQNSNLVRHLVLALQTSPTTNLESVSKLVSEICTTNSSTSEMVKSLLLAEDGALTKTLVELSKSKSVSTEAMKFLDEVILKVIMANQDDAAFFDRVASFFQGQSDFSVTLKSESLSEVLVGIKFMHALIKHKALFLLGDGLASSLDLLSRFPWANILHNVIMEMFIHVLHQGEDALIEQLIRADILLALIEGLVTEQPVGFLPHLRNIASALAESPSDAVRDYLLRHPLWDQYVTAMEFRNDKNLTFREAERLVVAALRKALGKEELPTTTTQTGESLGEEAQEGGDATEAKGGEEEKVGEQTPETTEGGDASKAAEEPTTTTEQKEETVADEPPKASTPEATTTSDDATPSEQKESKGEETAEEKPEASAPEATKPEEPATGVVDETSTTPVEQTSAPQEKPADDATSPVTAEPETKSAEAAGEETTTSSEPSATPKEENGAEVAGHVQPEGEEEKKEQSEPGKEEVGEEKVVEEGQPTEGV